MSNFVVSARKYRPMRFDDVVGQEHVSRTLKNALQNDHLAQAFLFCGPRGVGKTTCARILAKVINCENVTEDHEPCNECASCQSFNENASFNISELDAASNNSVEHIRALTEQVRFRPQQGKYRVFIIDEVHMLSTQAFNAFLKTLEEPPPYVVFILATTEKHKIIPTILSRCQIFDFKRIQVRHMVDHLQHICEQEGIEAEKDALHIIAQKADGALRDSLSIFDRIVSFSGNKITYEDVIDNLNVLDYDYFFRALDALLLEDVSQILLLFDEVLNKGFDGDHFINGLAEHFRNLLVAKDQGTLQLLEMSGNLKTRYQEQANLAPASFLVSALNLANECDVEYKMARNKRLHVEMALIKMTYLNRAIAEATNRPTPQAQEKKTAEPSKIVSAPPVNKPATPPPPPTETAREETSSSSPSEETDQQPASSTQPVSSNQPQKSLSNKGKLSTPKLTMNLEALDEEVENNQGQDVSEEKELTLELLQKLWDQYIETVNSDSVRSVLKASRLEVEAEKLIVTVGSSFAQSTVQQETALMDFLRNELNRQRLDREIRIDEEQAQKIAPPPKKILTPKEKYLQMREENPLVDQMRKRFDLKPDRE